MTASLKSHDITALTILNYTVFIPRDTVAVTDLSFITCPSPRNASQSKRFKVWLTALAANRIPPAVPPLSASLSGAVRRDADAEEPRRSVASSSPNVGPHALLFEAAARCWPLPCGAAVVSSGAAAGGSRRRRRRRGHGHPELEALHLRRDGLDCRRIR